MEDRNLCQQLTNKKYAKKWLRQSSKRVISSVVASTIKYKETETLRVLLGGGVSPNECFQYDGHRKREMTLLRNCVTQRNADALKVLIDFKVDLDFVPGLVNGVWTKSAVHTETNVHRAVQTLDSGEIVNLLVSAGADLSIQNKFGSTPLHTISICGNYSTFEDICKYKDINTSIHIALRKLNRKKLSPFGEAVSCFIEEKKKQDVKNGCYQIAKYILDHFEDLTISDRLQLFDSPHAESVLFAILNALEEHVHFEYHQNLYESERYEIQLKNIAELLIRNPKLLLDKNQNGDYPIHYFASLGLLNMVQKCPKEMFSLCNNMGWTSLHYAAESGRIDVIEFLLVSCSSSNNIADVKSRCGEYAYKIAEKNKKYKSAALILDHMTVSDTITNVSESYWNDSECETDDSEPDKAEFVVNIVNEEQRDRNVRFSDDPIQLQHPKSIDHWKDAIMGGHSNAILSKQLDFIGVQELKIEKYEAKIRSQKKKISSLHL